MCYVGGRSDRGRRRRRRVLHRWVHGLVRDHNDRPLERLRLPGESQYKLEGAAIGGRELTIIAMQTTRLNDDNAS